MRHLLYITFAILVLLFTSGCERSGETGHLFEHFALQDTLRLVEIVEIGSKEGTDVSMPSDPQVSSDGNIFAADTGYRDVRVFSPDGTLLHTMGGAGEGPGEFRSPVNLALGDQDSVFVYDRMLRRVSAFGPLPESSFAYSFGVGSSALRSPTEIFASQDGSLFSAYTRGVNREEMEEGIWITELNHEGAIVKDSLAHLPTMEMIRAQRGEGHMQAVAKPFGRYPLLRPSPTGYPCYGWTGHLRIQCLNEDGAAETLIDVPVPPRSVSADDRRDALERVEEVPNAATMIQEEGWHDTHPAYEIFTIESPERIWIRGLYDPRAAGDTFVSLWHVIDIAEESIYPVHLATPDDRIFAVQDGRVFAYRVIPETDETRVVVYQMDDA